MIIDSHCHPQFPQYDKDRGEMIKRALDEGIFMIAVGTDLETSKQAVELAQKYEGIWAAVGVHPNDVNNFEFLIFNFEKLLKDPKVVAIGEVGLDYYQTPEPEKQEKQKQVFQEFLNLAIQYDKPVILHARDAAKGTTGKVHIDILDILKNLKFKIKNSALRGVAHSFTGTKEEARQYLDLGFYLGFNGILTFPPSRKASEGHVPGMYDEVVKYAPLDRILLETDAPFLAPEPYRGKRNEPLYVKEVAKKVAKIKGISEEEVFQQTTLNCEQLFGVSLK